MPVMDGYETLAALGADPALRHIPVIVITGVDELDSVVRCLAMGAADYLPKTVDPAILQARIASSLARKRLHDAEREAIDRQAANNEVLAIMSRSVFDLQVVLDAVVRAALRLCRADYGVAYALDGETFRVAASAGGTPQLDQWERDHPIGPGRDSVVGRVALIGEAIRLDDVLADREYRATAGQQVGGYRSLIGVPIEQDGAISGVLALTRNEVRPFTDGEAGARDRLRRAGRDRDRERPAARDDRAPAGPARPVPLAPGRGARVEPRRRGDAGRPPPRDHGDVLRPAQLHGVLGDRPSPRRSSASCGATTRRSAGSSSSSRGRSSTSPATG